MKKSISIAAMIAIVLPLVVIIAAGARYIVVSQWERARMRTEITRLERERDDLADVVAARPAAPDDDEADETKPPTAPTGPRQLSASQRAAIVAELATEAGSTRAVWFATAARDREAAAYQAGIQSAFEEAGWEIRSDDDSTFAMRPGIFFLMADAEPSGYVVTALDALKAAGMDLVSGRDYRSFSEAKIQEEPNWRGFKLAADQTYIVAIGRNPNP